MPSPSLIGSLGGAAASRSPAACRSGVDRRTARRPRRRPRCPAARRPPGACQSGSCAAMSSGRPETSTTTTGTPVALSLASTAQVGLRPGPWSRCGRPGPPRTASRRSRRWPRRRSQSMPSPRRAVGRRACRARRLARMPCRIVVPGVIGPVAALPADRPAAALVADVVGALAGHEDLAELAQRQDSAVVLQQHLRLAHRLAREGAVRGAADRARCRTRSVSGCSNRPSSNFLVRMRRLASSMRAIGHGAAAAPRSRMSCDERLVVGRHHHHVDAGVDRRWRTSCGGEAGLPVDLVDAVPVGDHEAGEAELALEHVGDQVLVAVRP